MNIVIFDFDNTITKFNVNFNVGMRSVVQGFHLAAEHFADYKREELFCKLFQSNKFIDFLRREKRNGTIFVVVSFGFNDVVRKVVYKHGLSDIFSDYLTPSSFGYADGYEHIKKFRGKNMVLKYLMKKYGIHDKRRVMILDDNPHTIEYARKDGFIYYHSAKTGLDKQCLPKLVGFIRNRN